MQDSSIRKGDRMKSKPVVVVLGELSRFGKRADVIESSCKNYLIVGASGVIGSTVARRLASTLKSDEKSLNHGV